MKTNYILRNAKVINGDGQLDPNVDIFVKDGKIIKTIIAGKLDNRDIACLEDAEVIDCTDRFVTPGFVNLHTHSAMNIFKGIAEDVHIDDWFNREIFPYESKMKAEHVYAGAMAAVMEMINNGVTAFADHYFFAEKICDVIEATGIRGDIAPTIFGMSENFEEQLESISRLIEKRNGRSENLKLRMGPHAPYTCPGDTLKRIVEQAKQLKVGIHIHVSETKKQVGDSLLEYGKTPFEVLYDAGGFELPVIIAHGLWIMDGDRRFLNSNTHIAVSPKTYMKLSMGVGTIWTKAAELPLCTGTDGAASSNSLDPLEQGRLYALMGKMINGDATAFALKDIWKMLMRGHKALNFNTGEIKEGFNADLLIWDLDQYNTTIVHNPLAAIIYSANAQNITHTMVAGKFLKKDGKVVVDKEETVNKLILASQEILSVGKGKTSIVF